MSPFKRAAVKGGSSKGKEPVIAVDNLSPKIKRTRKPSEVFDPNKFRSYAAFQTHKGYFRDATPLLGCVNQSFRWRIEFNALDDIRKNI